MAPKSTIFRYSDPWFPTGKREAACNAVIQGLDVTLLPSPELPAIILMFLYLGAVVEVMLPMVALIVKLLESGNHMFDCPLQCHTSPNATFEIVAFEYSPVPVQPVHSAKIV